ncbi:MAG: pilus assembly protein CpaE [Pseudomonadota bacterium]|nr:pilus assembly protein CpaE [Pseudomonadota bacterium]
MKIKVISPIPLQAEAWRSALATSDRTLQVEILAQPLDQLASLANGSLPDLIVVELVSGRDFDALERLAAQHPEVEVVLVSDALPPERLMRAMRAGVREVVPAPVEPAALVAAVQRVVRKRHAAAPPSPPARPAQELARVLAFISCKGGSGATFIAANVAHLLAEGGRRRVALIDLNLQFGDALLFLGSTRAGSDVATVAASIDRLDRQLLQSAMIVVSPGVHVLAAPDDPSRGGEVTPAHVEAIVQLARTLFDVVVIDAGRALTGVTLQALDQADRVCAVLQLTLPFVRDGRRLREVFRSLGYADGKTAWLVNRHEKGSQISLDDLRRTLGITEVLTLPNDYMAAAASVNQGVPMAEVASSSALSRALADLARQLVPGTTSPAERPRSWLRQLFGGTSAGTSR